MPYPGEHAARQTDPDQYDRFRRAHEKGLPDGIDFIYGIKDNEAEVQSVRAKADKWTVPEFRKWLKDHGFKTEIEPAAKPKKGSKAMALHPQITAKALADGAVELTIYGEIGASSIWGEGVSSRDVAELLKEHPGAKLLNVRINSPGGLAFEGIAIHNLLSQHPARIEVDVDGVALSAASIVAMAGDQIRMAENALLMIHEPWDFAIGNAEHLRDQADKLDKLAGAIARTYATRTGKSVEDVLQLMADETWLNADEAMAAGFADAVTAPVQMAAALRPELVERYRNVPQSLVAAADSAAAAAAKAVEQKLISTLGAAFEQLTLESIADVSTSANRPDAADHNTKELETMKNIVKALGLSEDADETAVVAAIGKLQTRASLATELEALIGAQGPEAVGAVRAMAEKAQERDEFASELAEVKGSKVRDEFSALLKDAQEGKEKKLTPAMAKYWQERFDRPAADEKLTATQRNEKRSEVRAELEGYLKVASPVVPKNLEQPAGKTGSAGSALTHEGKAFEELKPMERHVLKEDDPEQYNLMRNDALRRGVL